MSLTVHTPVTLRFGTAPNKPEAGKVEPTAPNHTFAITVSSDSNPPQAEEPSEKTGPAEWVSKLFGGLAKNAVIFYQRHIGFESEDQKLDFYLKQARQDVLQGKANKAFRIFAWAESKNPGRLDTFLEIGRQLSEMIQYKQSGYLNEENRKSQLKGIEFPELKAAMQHIPVEDLENEALKAYEKAHRLEPKLAEPMTRLAELHESRGNLEVAKGYLKQLTQTYPDQAGHYAKLGEFYSRRKNLDKAIHKFTKAIELAPEDDAFHARLAQLQFQKGDFKAAEQHLQIATQKNGSNPQYYDTLSQVYSALGEHEAATQASRNATQLLLEREKRQNPTKLNG